MTYKDFKAEILGQIFAGFPGQPENLIAVHDAFFLQALYDIQTHIPCARSNHRTRYDHCATYFECGMTVLPQPSKFITGLFVVDRLDPDTGLENPDVDLQWCEKVYYDPVQYCHISRYVSLCQKSGNLMESLADVFSNFLFGVYRRKRRYPEPTPLSEINAARVAAGQTALLALPEGYHYPDASTDAAGRSPGGVFALHHGRIYIAPWIQSTETVVVLSNGIKTKFNPLDLIDDSPKLKQAVRLHVTHQHESSYGDAAKARDAYDQLWSKDLGAMEALRVECLEQSRVHGCNEATGSMAVGIAGLESGNSFYNDQRVEYTATCPAGKTGSPVTVVKEVGSVPSALSVADANALAAQQAASEANAQLVCVVPAVTYLSLAVIGHASCPGPQSDGTPQAVGPDTTASLPAGYSTSTTSVEAATALAQTAADALAAQQLVCTFYNKAQTATYHCPATQVQVGADGTATVAAGSYTGSSQALANASAYAEALRLAKIDFIDNGGLCNAVVPTIFYNTPLQVVFTKACSKIPPAEAIGGGTDIEPCYFNVVVTINVSGGTASGDTQLLANDAAREMAKLKFDQVTQAFGFCNQFPCSGGAISYSIGP